MNYSPLGHSGLQVSRVCLGTMTFGNPIDKPECLRLVSAALERGVNFFDTSNTYEGYKRTLGSGGGLAEEILGEALDGRRDEAIICTKFGNPVGVGPFDAGLSARHLERELDKSLRRLRTDRIDLVLAHRWDASAFVDDLWRIFDRWVDAGKALAVGVSNWPVWRIAQASEIAATRNWPKLTVSSPRYNLLTRNIELEHIPCAVQYGVALVPYQPFQGGILTGKYRAGHEAPRDSRAFEKPNWMPVVSEAVLDKVQILKGLAEREGATPSQYALAWLLSRPGVASVVVGCRNLEQLDGAVAAASLGVTAQQLLEIDSLFPPPKPASGEQVLRWKDASWHLEETEI